MTRNRNVVLEALDRLIEKYPDLRVGQTIQNAASWYGADTSFYVEDEDLAGVLHLWSTLGDDFWASTRGGAAKALLLDRAKKDLGL